MLISVNIFLEGNEGVKERRLQNDQRPPKCQRFFMKDNPYLARAYLPEFAKMKNQFLWALTKVSRRNQVICSSFAFPGFVGTAQHSYDFQIQVVLAQRFSFHYCPGSGSDLFLPLLVAPRRCHLRAVVQMLHPCISFLHKRRDIAVLLQFHTFDAVFRNRPSPVYRRIFQGSAFASMSEKNYGL